MVYIPAGTFVMGSDEDDKSLLGKEFGAREGKFFENEKPQRTIDLKEFYIDKFEVTNNDYKSFLKNTKYKRPPNWIYGLSINGWEDFPVTVVSWYDANEYCKWRGKRLPTEEEWEKAARGPNGNKYPWGNIFDESKANLGKTGAKPVGTYLEDKSFYGVYDMAGNVTEWTDTWYAPYPGSRFVSRYSGKTNKVVRGSASRKGHYTLGSYDTRSSYRDFHLPTALGGDVGFRCAKSS